MFARIREDIRNVFDRDPAARSVLEVLFLYPGLHALWLHRIAHGFWRRRLKLLGRAISHFSRALTGIEIHPGARIGRRVFIDHGMGVVIGETTEIGDDVLLYTGVVLGGTSLEKKKRHPTVGNNVVIGTGAIVLGAISIGKGARIGAGSVVVRPVPPGATVVGVPARMVEAHSPQAVIDLEHGKLPDPLLRVLDAMAQQQRKLEDRIEALEKELKAEREFARKLT
jgi:serine O-acetyltransferase